MTSNDRIKQRIMKLVALAKKGVGGERVNAQSMLNKLLKQHNISLEELDNESQPLELFEFYYNGEFELRLLFQVMSQVLATSDIEYFRTPRARTKIKVEMTKAQKIEVDTAFEVYSKGLVKELDRCLNAFIQKNAIFPLQDNFSNTNNTSLEDSLSQEELDAIYKMMQGINIVERFTSISQQ